MVAGGVDDVANRWARSALGLFFDNFSSLLAKNRYPNNSLLRIIHRKSQRMKIDSSVHNGCQKRSSDMPLQGIEKKSRKRPKVKKVMADDMDEDSDSTDPLPDISIHSNQDVLKERGKVVVNDSPSLAVKPSIFASQLDAPLFRCINERLYTSTSSQAAKLLQHDPSAISIYHRGYSSQMEKWPKKPLDPILSKLRKLSGESKYAKKRSSKQPLVIADIGCGDAKIAHTMVNCVVYSFDLCNNSNNPFVVTCDAAEVHGQLPAESVDVCVFCLSLMPTNYADFIFSAGHILRHGGTLMIAEVTSRFDSDPRAKFSTAAFSRAIEHQGYEAVRLVQEQYFVLFEFKRVASDDSKQWELRRFVLKPCLYKKR
jgi:ribosomal RNA-processing protein 8